MELILVIFQPGIVPSFPGAPLNDSTTLQHKCLETGNKNAAQL